MSLWLNRTLFFSLFTASVFTFASDFATHGRSSCDSVLNRLGSNPAIVKDNSGNWMLARKPLEYGSDGRPEGRGFLGSGPHGDIELQDPRFKKFIDENGIIYWRQMVHIFPSFKEAREFFLSPPRRYQSGKFDPLQRHLFYIAGPDFERIKKMVITSSMDEEQAKRVWQKYSADHRHVFQKMLLPPPHASKTTESSMYYVSETIAGADGRPDFVYKALPKSELNRFDFNFDNRNRFTDFTSNSRTDLVYEFWGWVKVPVRGVVKIADFFANTEKVRDFEKMARKFHKNGIVGSITFNTTEGMRRVIEIARDQFRKGQGEGGGLYSQSRFNPAFIQSQIDGLKDGTTFSVEVRNPQNEVIGGFFGMLQDGVLYSDSIAYPKILKWKRDESGKLVKDSNGELIPVYETNKDGSLKRDKTGSLIQSTQGVEIAKIGKLFFFKKLLDAGFEIQDSVMVSAFTESIGGGYVSSQEFSKFVANAKAKNVDLRVVDWSPITVMPEPRAKDGSRK